MNLYISFDEKFFLMKFSLLKFLGCNTSDFSPKISIPKIRHFSEERNTAGFSPRIAPSGEFSLSLLPFPLNLLVNFSGMPGQLLQHGLRFH